MTTPRPLPGQTRRMPHAIPKHPAGHFLRVGDAESFRWPHPNTQRNSHHTHCRADQDECSSTEIVVEELEHFGEPRSHYCGENFPRRTASSFVASGEFQTCTEFYAASRLSPAKCRDAPCRAGTFLSHRHRGHGGQDIYGPRKPQRSSPLLLARTSAPLSVGWQASSSRRRSFLPCLSRSYSRSNPAPDLVANSGSTQN